MALRQLALVAFVALALGACEEQERYGGAKHNVPIPSATYALMSTKGMNKSQPILIRSFKKESELEVWKRKDDGKYALLKTYPMCRWSGQLGPKKREGDRMAPEGFYSIGPAQMNPNSSFYVSFNMGYPNAYDRAQGRTGAHLMVHGACSSAGCYSMTDDQISEIYALIREAHDGGQRAVQMQALPFRMTPENLAQHRKDPNIAFWTNLKEGTDYFEVTQDEPRISVAGNRYQINGGQVEAAVRQKRQQDETRTAALVSKGTPAIALLYEDGDQHPSFKSQLASVGSESLNRTAAWGSRDVGISRPEALATGPRVAVLDDSGRTKRTIRVASAENDVILAAVAATASEPDQQSEAPAKPEPTRAAPALRARASATQIARTEAAPAAAQPAPAPAPADEPFYRRALGFLPGFGQAPQPQTPPVASNVPDAPVAVPAPLPPRRSGEALRTSRLDGRDAAYASQPALR